MDAHQIVSYEGRLFIYFLGICDLQYECSQVIEIDENGKILWQKELSWLDGSSKSMVIANDTIFISGNHPQRDRWLWHQMSVDGGDSLATYEIFEEGNIFTRKFNLGQLKYGNNFILYGSGSQNDLETSLFYFLTHDGRIDTLLTPIKIEVEASVWEVIPDNEGNLVAFIRYREEGKNRQRVVAKINADKELFWAYFSEENSQQDAIPNGVILEDGTIVYNSREQFNKAEKLRGIGPDSTIVWWHDPTNATGQNREYTKLYTISDGSILGVGRFGNRNLDPSIIDVPWITKVGNDESKIWEKVYYAWQENGVDEQGGRFRDAIELSDGSIMAVGWLRPFPGENWVVLLARLDSDGCLEPDCGVFNDVTELLTNTNSVTQIDFELYPNPVTDYLQIQWEATPDRIEIYDISGHLMMVKYDLTTIDVTDLPQGIYLLKLFSKGEVGMKRFMKI